MKICVIGKVSPIQGGVSKLNFWMCQALAEAGHEVHLVTNGAEVEAQYRTVGGKLALDLADSPLAGLSDRLTVHYTNEKSHYSYIPYANPFVSKLSSMAIEVIRKHGCDLIFGHYFEPYGVAAYLASKATGVPYGLQHAGSDIARLLQSPELRTIYGEIIRSADYLFVSNSTRRRFIQEGANPDRLYSLPRSTHADHLYTPDCASLDLEKHVAKARGELKGTFYEDILDQFPISNYVPGRASIGIYGKTGESKGSYDLIESLKILKERGVDFNFFALTNSGKKSLTTFLQKVVDAGLADRMIWLPFVPHWKVPQFIKLCDVVCFLERDFSIPIHQPAVAVEVLMCATCLVVSDEIASKQRYKAELKDGENILVVSPKDIGAMASKIETVLTDKSLAQAIGAAGRATILAYTESFETLSTALSDTFKVINQNILDTKGELSMIEFQSFLTRLYTDDIFRKLNALAPDAAESFFSLTQDEKAMVRQLETRAVDEFASSLKAKSRQRHQSVFPLTTKMLGKGKANAYFDRFYSLNRPYPGESKLALTSRFGQFLEDVMLADGMAESAVVDLIRFERKYVELSLRTGPSDDFSKINHKDTPVLTLDADAVIYLRDSVHIDKFGFDIPALVERLKSEGDEALPNPEPLVTNVIFIVAANEALPKVLKVNEASVLLLKLASSRISLVDLTEQFSVKLGKPAQRKDVMEATLFFAKSGMLMVEQPAEAGA